MVSECVRQILLLVTEEGALGRTYIFARFSNYIYLSLGSNDCNRTVDMTLYILEHASMHCSTAYEDEFQLVGRETIGLGVINSVLVFHHLPY